MILLRSLRRPAVPSRAFFIPPGRSDEELASQRGAREALGSLTLSRPYVARHPPNPETRNIAIIGGGITGLSTAFYLSGMIPAARITIFEKGHRLGGWIESERLQVSDGDVLFEWGPRTLRHSGDSDMHTIDLMSRIFINGVPPLIAMSKDALASRNRFIYYAGKLVRMPGMRSSMLRSLIDAYYRLLVEPIFNGMFEQLVSIGLSSSSRAASTRDESVGQFMRRNFGQTATHNLASAFVHGIYAGNIDKLSVRTLFPYLWHVETLSSDRNRSLIWKMVKSFRTRFVSDPQLQAVSRLLAWRSLLDETNPSFQVGTRREQITDDLAKCSMYTLPDGLQQLSDSLVSSLSINPNVTLSTLTEVNRLDYKHSNQVINIAASRVDLSRSSSPKPRPSSAAAFDYVISTVSPATLSAMLNTTPTSSSSQSHSQSISERAQLALDRVSHAVTVMVVNLYFPSPDLLPPSLQGFGYLIPSSVGADENHERALGVLFSSNSSGIRGPDAIELARPQTAADLRSKRESLERQLSAGHKAEIWKNKIKLYGDGLGKLIDDEIWGLYEKDVKHQIELIKKWENEAHTREARPDYDPANDFEEIRVGQDTAGGTKLTVMLGGHWWDDWEESDLPTEEEGIAKAKSVLARHLHITEEPEVAKARLQRNCIPQYVVGYRDYMASIHNDILDPVTGKFGGRLKVAGAWWQGAVGVNDCIRSGFDVAAAVREHRDEFTGLDKYVGNEKWLIVRADSEKGEVVELDKSNRR